MAYATLTDVTNKWAVAAGPATIRATTLLEDAHAELASKRRTLAADVAAGLVDPILVRKVITDAVIRVLANPAGVSGQTLGPEAVQFTGVRTLGTVAFTQAELDSLDPSTAPSSVGGDVIGSARLRIPSRLRAGIGVGWVGERGELGALEDMAPSGAAAMIAELDAEILGAGPVIEPALLDQRFAPLDRDGNA